MKKTMIVIGVTLVLIACIAVSVFIVPQCIVKDITVKTVPTKTTYTMTQKTGTNGQPYWSLEEWTVSGLQVVSIDATGRETVLQPKDYKIFYPAVNDAGAYNITVTVSGGKKDMLIPITVVKA